MSDDDGNEPPIDYRRWLSVSRLGSVAQCGRAYELERVEKVPSRPAAWTVRGISAHAVIEEWERSGRELDYVGYYVDVAWPEAYEKTVEKYPDVSNWMKTPGRVSSVKRDIELRKQDGLDQIQTYVDHAREEEDLWEVLDIEFAFKLEYPEFFIVGYIDQVRRWIPTDEKYIVDVKTGGDSNEKDPQLGIYGFGYEQMTGEPIEFGQYYYPKLGRYSHDIDLTVYTEEYILAEFKKLDKILAQKLFLANPSFDNCKFCGVSDHCLEAKLR
jgi:CRISPR/Cas system-associated exonuclease Cas4 (RecB family)